MPARGVAGLAGQPLQVAQPARGLAGGTCKGGLQVGLNQQGGLAGALQGACRLEHFGSFTRNKINQFIPHLDVHVFESI